MRPGLLLTAVALGSSIIAVGLYLGLRASTPPALPPASANVPSSDQVARVHAEARAQLDARREVFLSRCWPAAREHADRANLTFSLAFDPHGLEIGRGVSEARRAGRDEIAACLRERAREPLRVAPPGAFVSIEVPFTLP